MACLNLRSAEGVSIRAHRVGDWVKIPSQSQINNVRVRSGRCLPRKAMLAKCSSTTMEAVRGQGGSHLRGEPEKFDRWMKEAIGDIVRNLKEAPLFVQVYSGADTRLKTERAVAEEWRQLKSKWVEGEEPPPDGIILVEELKEDEVEILEEDEGQNRDCTKAWGVLIQGKGEYGGVACYLLKTSKVGCGNLGLFCTHYCLVRVKSFRETFRSQLTSCWLA